MNNIYCIENGWFYVSFMKSFTEEYIIFQNTANVTTIEQDLQKIESSDAQEISDSLVISYLTTNLWDQKE